MTSSKQTVLCRYSYDPLDRLASSTPTGQAGIQRFYQKNRLATEIQGALRRTVFQHDDLLLAQQRRVDGALETTLLATDQQRSVLQLVDKAGPEPIAYSPYGHHPAESGLTSLLGFNGERRDPVTGHYLLGNGYRAYNPVLMRFNSPDSLSPFDEGGLNAYGYVGGDPVGFGDETGHVKFRVITTLAASNADRSRPSVIKWAPPEMKKGPQKVVASVPLNFEFSYTHSSNTQSYSTEKFPHPALPVSSSSAFSVNKINNPVGSVKLLKDVVKSGLGMGQTPDDMKFRSLANSRLRGKWKVNIKSLRVDERKYERVLKLQGLALRMAEYFQQPSRLLPPSNTSTQKSLSFYTDAYKSLSAAAAKYESAYPQASASSVRNPS
ncbi:RHS repeat-associated core domain-containing protein [Pseudomonas cannabina]|uniref:RHS repeat-associated core domain-containing protein n=1 Tax=Pseudomonas cannabina TaxID=86840 RepID=UPI001EE3A8C3|nr:RHS repeat-associated core domain-containing protein [Pseudomonas cannabina]